MYRDHDHRFSTLRSLAVLLILAAIGLSACQQSQAEGPNLSASDAWGRPSPGMAGAGAVYVVLENKGSQADRLISAASDAAKMVEIHESYLENDVMKMRPVEGGLEIPAGAKVELKPGGYHVMLMGLTAPLEAGNKITVTLRFEHSGDLPVEVEIRGE